MDNYKLPSTNLNNLRILFIDDELEGNAKIFNKFLKGFFGEQNVTSYFDEQATLEFFRENSKDFDIAFIDYSLANNVRGDAFGSELSTISPYIVLIMLSADGQFNTCRSAMRNGFDDYLLKIEYASISEAGEARQKFYDAIEPILTLPSVQAKLKMKAESLNDKLKISRLTKEKNNLLIKTMPTPQRKSAKIITYDGVKQMLDNQEFVFKIGQQLSENQSINGDTLAFCMLLLEHNKEKEKEDVLTITILKEIAGHDISEMAEKYDRENNTPRATIQGRLKFYESDMITSAARYVYHLLVNNPTEWTLTREKAKSRTLNPKSRNMATYIDEIILDFEF